MSDRRYSTARWQRLRRAVLQRDSYVCQIQGPRCTGRATSAHHILPSSQYPELFWDASNIEAACGACNYAGAAYMTADSRSSPNKIAHFERVVEVQQARIDELAEALARHQNAPAPEPARRHRPRPAIFPNRFRRGYRDGGGYAGASDSKGRY